MTIIRPMLAATLTDLSVIRYPVLATPKLDGIRCLVIDGKAVSRTFKPIPNRYTRNYLEECAKKDQDFNWLDGELTVGDKFQDCSSGIMSHDGCPKFTY